jgi:hypothetical protein
MHQHISIKAAELFSAVDEILEQGGSAWITVTGMSMFPFLREGRDSVELSKTSFESIRRGDIVLIRRESGAYVLHRVCKKSGESFFIIGDAQQWVEGPIRSDQLKAVVTGIKKGERNVNMESIIQKLSVELWLFVIPIRNKIFKLGRYVKRLFNHRL